MSEITFALLSDGSSDKRLLPVLRWLIRQHCPDMAVQAEWADFGGRRPKTLSKQILKCIELYPCNLLFIHRDAENQTLEFRKNEIMTAVRDISEQAPNLPAICVIPVRMQEAWLLFDESAIRKAASNPNGRIRLQLPNLSTVETLPDPKMLLYDLLKTTSELRTGRLKKLKLSQKAHLVAEYITDYTSLRRLSAFSTLETDLIEFFRTNAINQAP